MSVREKRPLQRTFNVESPAWRERVRQSLAILRLTAEQLRRDPRSG